MYATGRILSSISSNVCNRQDTFINSFSMTMRSCSDVMNSIALNSNMQNKTALWAVLLHCHCTLSSSATVPLHSVLYCYSATALCLVLPQCHCNMLYYHICTAICCTATVPLQYAVLPQCHCNMLYCHSATAICRTATVPLRSIFNCRNAPAICCTATVPLQYTVLPQCHCNMLYCHSATAICCTAPVPLQYAVLQQCHCTTVLPSWWQ